MANIPENTMPIAVSSFIRLFSFKYPTPSEQKMPEKNAPIAKGIPAK